MSNRSTRRLRPGDLLTVRPIACGYPLPAHLPQGSLARLIAFDRGFWAVEVIRNR